MPGALPAVRLEQVILLFLLPSLAMYTRNHWPRLGITFIDYAFAALGVAMAITLAVAPIILEQVTWSLRDPFELARVAEYWFLYRLGLTVVVDRPLGRQALVALFVLAVAVAAFSVVQYVGPGNFNSGITSIWAQQHHLNALERTGRVVGTVGNANYYGAFSGLLLVLALGAILLKLPMDRRLQVLAFAAVFAATLSVVMSQSRTATFALLGAMFIGLLFVAWRMRGRAAYVPAIGAFTLSALLSVGFVQAVQPEVGSWATRFQIDGLTTDSSVELRMSRWRSMFAGFFETRPSFCEGEQLHARPPAAGHEAAASTGAPPADEAVSLRDAQRRDDVATLTQGVLDYFCANKEWPADQSLEEALVPAYLPELPVDPATGEPYLYYVSSGGFLIGARLEDRSDPEGPIYSLGTIPNFVVNASFTTGAEVPDRWLTTGEAEATIVPDEGLFGDSSVRAHLAIDSAFMHNVVLDFGQDRDYVARVWAKPVGDEPVELELYLAASLGTGDVIDPYGRQAVTLEPGVWQPITVPFRTPESGRITILRFIVRDPNAAGAEVYLDGATVSQGTFAPSFPHVRTVDPSRLADTGLPGFSDSPIVGAGPRKEIEQGAVDNEYFLFLDRYGAIGTVAYLALFGGAFVVAFRSWRNDSSFTSVLALTMMVFIIMLAVFNITAGSYYHFQIMAVFWLLMGLLAGTRLRGRDTGTAE